MTDATCDLCDLPADPPVTGEDGGTYCCRGCRVVAASLDDVADADAADARAALTDDADADAADGETAFVRVDGMHCATCEAYVEATLTDSDGVVAAEASYPSGAAKVVHDPETVADPSALSVPGYDVRAPGDEGDRDDDDAVGRLLVGGFFGMMVMLWYVLFLYPTYYGLGPAVDFVDLSGSAGRYLLANVAVLSGVVLVYTGRPTLRGALVSLRAGRPNMDLLVALAATTAYAYSVVALLLGRTEVYFDVAVVVVLAVTLGGYYERRTVRRAAEGLGDLAAARVTDARRRTDAGTETVPVEALDAGDEVVVPAGERVPADGTVVEGTAAVDNSLVTGESVPVETGPGEAVVGGAVVESGSLVVAVGQRAESTLDRLVRTLWDVKSSRPGVQRLADRLAAVFVPLVVGVAAVAFAWRLLAGAAPVEALLTALTVLVVSCPCALGLATPLAVATGVDRGLDRGVVVADGSVFEVAGGADVVVLDKTGTLTTGEMRVVDAAGEPAGFGLAAAVETAADHPVADAVAAYADPTGEPTDFDAHPGRGVSAVVDGRRVRVGRPSLFEGAFAVPEALATRAEAAREAGRVPTFVGWDGRVRSLLVVGDDPREDWRDTVSALAASAERVVVLTGDARRAADPFAAHPGVDEVFADVPPSAKGAVVGRLRAEGTVAMVGDGSNDAPGLARADLGIAMAGGTELAVDAADAVVTGPFRTVPLVFDLTRAVRRRVRENLAWAFCYNLVAIPAAALGALNPLVAAVAMAASSLLVVGNSVRPLDLPAADASASTDEGGASTADATRRGASDAARERAGDDRAAAAGGRSP